MRELWTCWLGTVEYRAAQALQEAVRAARQAGDVPDVLLLLEHPPVYTLGRRASDADLPMGEAWYRMQGIDVAPADRGGRLTYHGPGQLVGYPVVRTDKVVDHVRRMEAAVVAALAEEGIAARTRTDEGADYTGVWVQDRKIASIGVHVQRGVTTHGFAVNVANDLQPFEWAVPCGLAHVRMTSLTRELGREASLGCFRRRVAHALAREMGSRQRIVAAPRILGLAAASVH